MEQTIKKQLLQCIGKIYENSGGCLLQETVFVELETELSCLSGYFKVSNRQALFIAIVFTLNYKGNKVDLHDIISHFNCNPMKILEYSDDFEFLYERHIFIKHRLKRGLLLEGANVEFTINEKITEAIIKNNPLPEIHEEKIENVIDLLEKLYQLGELRDTNEIITAELFLKTQELLAAHLHFPLIKQIHEIKLGDVHQYLYLYLIWKTLNGRESYDLSRALEGIYDNASMRILYMQEMLAEQNILLKNDLIELVKSRFFNDTEIKLSTKSIEMLNANGINLLTNEKKNDNIMDPQDIVARELIFSEADMKQLFLLKESLSEQKFKETQQRLIAKNLPKGITVLLHGAPGTGKTEVVKQIAKETNRKLIKVEISQSKSLWYGESEKIIKRIFTDYRKIAEKSERTPILLFNEADAIISKRKEAGGSAVDQTENAIQNILLEEIENFEGILIATTNLAQNLDSAFDRRFLFKIPFEKPDTNQRAKIWKLKMPFLSIEDCNMFAEKFDFSGGQIDNIVRKNEIHELIYGKTDSLENLITFCSEEKLNGNIIKLGFIKS